MLKNNQPIVSCRIHFDQKKEFPQARFILSLKLARSLQFSGVGEENGEPGED